MQLTKGAIGNLINRYKAVLKKCHLMNTFGSLAVAGMLVMGGAGVAVAAEDVALGAGGSYDKTEVNHLMGGGLYKDNNLTANKPVATDITLTVEGGSISEIIGGSYISGTNADYKNATHGTITTIISGETTSAEFVVGGSKLANNDGATLETGTTAVTINGGTFGTDGKTNAYELVMGGNYIKTGTGASGTATTDGSSVTVNGGTFHASVVGGSVAHRYNGTGVSTVTDNGNTSVVITGGTFNPSASSYEDVNGGINLKAAVIGGGLAYGANTSTVLGSDTRDVTSRVAINGGEIHGKVVAGSVVANGGYAAVIHGDTLLSMSGGTVNDDLVGGGMVQDATSLSGEDAPSHNLIVTGNAGVTVDGGTATGEIVGGNYVRGNGSARVENSSVTITSGTFSPDTANKAQYVIGGNKSMAYGSSSSKPADVATTLVEKNSGVRVSGDVVDIVDGAVVGGSMAKAEKDGKATATVAGNSGVQVDKGSLAGVVGGGLAETYSHTNGGAATSSVGGTSSVTINGGTIKGIAYGAVAGNAGTSSAAVVGGGLANDKGSSASVTNTSVTIAGGKIDGKVVAGGLAINGGTTMAGGNTLLIMTGGEVSSDLIGGNLLEKGGQEGSVIASTTVNVKDGTVAGEIYGGSYVRNTAATSTVDSTTLNISGGSIGATEPQGWAQYVVGGGKAMSNATMTASNVTNTATVNISGGDIKRGAVVGGGFARAQGASDSATANVKDSVVNLTGGTLVGVVGGGLAENLGTASSTATANVTGAASLTIDGNATVNGIIYKGNDAGNTSPSAAVIGGGLAYSQNNSEAIASVKTANTTIKGGTIKGDVYAGGMADGTGAKANVTETANLTITDGTINGNVYAGGYTLDNGTANVTTANVTLKGGSITGKVTVGNATNAIITLDGTGAKVTGGFEGNETSTLTFNNYNGTFENVAIGFGTLAVAENSNVYVDALVSGQRGSDRPNTGIFGAPTPTDEGSLNPTGNGFTITGGGTITAKEFHVNPDASVTIEHGNVVADDVKVQSATLTVGSGSASAGFTVNNALTFENVDEKPAPSIHVENLGTATLDQKVVLDDEGKIDTTIFTASNLQVNTGGTLKLEGLDGKTLTADELAALQATTQGGLLDIGGATIADVATGEDGNYAYSNVSGITSDQFINAGVAVDNGEAGAGISGGFKNVQLTEDATELKVNGTLQLAGSTAGGDLVATNGDNPGNLNVQNGSVATLGREDANNQGTLGDVTLNASGILNVIGQGRAEFTTDNIVATGGGTTAVVNVSGATLNTQQIDPTNGLSKLNITNGAVHAAGDVKVNDLALAGGVLAAHEAGGAAGTPDGGNITISNTLSGQGSVVADKTLTLGANYTGAADDVLTLQAGGDITATGMDLKQADNGKLTVEAGGTITAKDISATKVAAKTLTASGDVAVDGGTLKLTDTGTDVSTVDSLKLTNGTQADIKGSLKLGGTGTGTGTDKTLTVGTGDDTAGGTTLSAKHINLDGGMLLVDPAWGLASSNVAVESLSAGSVGVGRNSYLALGTADTGWLPGVVGNYTKGVGLSETGITAALGVFKGIEIAAGKNLTVDGSKTGTEISNGWTLSGATNTAEFANNSLLVVNGADEAIAAGGAAITFAHTTGGTLTVAEGAKLLVTDAVAGQTYTIVGNVATSTVAGWKNNGMTSTTDMISLGNAVFDAPNNEVTTAAVRNDAHTVFPNLSDGMANAVNDLYTGHAGAAGQPNWDYADVNSDQMGVRFLSRATDNRFLGMDKDAAAATIESAARIAFAGAVPQMTKMASDAGTNAVVNRLGFADPADGAQAMDAEGKIVDRNTTGFALWIAPLWQSQHGWGMDADSMDYGFNGNLGGVSLGADYTFENAIRAGITFNIGGGYAESSGGDLSSTDNRMNFWGLGAYAGWNYENFGVMADVSYTSTWNQLKQDVDSRMGMGDLEADVQATAISAGLRAEYLLQTSAMDIIPHIGVRYMSLNTWGYDVDTHGGTVLEGDSLHQDIWTFPIGVTFSKDIALDSGWNFKPSLDFSVIPAAGDIKAKHDVHFTGLPGTYEVETQMMDYLTWQGGVGLELANDNMSIGVNYTLQAGQHTTGHGVFGSFRYEF